MTYLFPTSMIFFALALIFGILGATEGEFILFAGSFWAAIIGIAFLAARDALRLLTEIRDSLTQGTEQSAPGEMDSAPSAPMETARSIEEIAADIERMKRG